MTLGAAKPSIAVVVATRDRRRSLLRTLDRLRSLPERPPVVVVDNASTDGTPEAVAAAHPDVRLIVQGTNRGAVARNVGVEAVATPYVAFSDDDSWWEPGSLARAVRLLQEHSGVAVLAARVRVGQQGDVDPTCIAMAESPLGRPDGLPGPRVLGFIGCGAVVRRSAFLAVGGFNTRLGLVGEERLLAVDLAAAGWSCAYASEVVAVHHPSTRRDVHARRRLAARNELLFSWLRLPALRAARRSLVVASAGLGDRDVRAGLASAARELPAVLGERRVLPRPLARAADRVA